MSDGPPADKPRPTRVRYVVLAWLCAAAAFAYVTRNSISVAEETVRESLELTKQQMGSAMGAFFWAYAFLQVPTAWLSHIWGSRVALPVFSLLGSVTTALFAAADGFWSLWIARFGMGLAQAGLFPAATNTLTRWFPTTQRGLASGVLTCFMSIGGVLGNVTTGGLLKVTSWQVVFLTFTIPTFVWAVWFWWWFRERPSDHRAVNPTELAFIQAASSGHTPKAVAGPGDPVPWLAILASPAMFWICFQQFFRAAGYIYFTTWFATYLKETRAVTDDLLVGILNSIPILGVVVGSFVGGVVSDWLIARTGSRRIGRQALAVVTHLVCALLILVGYQIPEVWPAVLVISVAALIGSFGAPCAYAITMDMGGRYTPTVFALMNMSGNLGAAIFPDVVPWILEHSDWNTVMLAFTGIYVAAALCWIPFNADGTIVKEPAPLASPH